MGFPKDHYRTLSVPPSAQFDAIHDRYRSLMRKYHPDNPDNHDRRQWAEEKARQVVEAFSVLKDESRRRQYDNQPQFQPRRHKTPNGPLKTRAVVAAKVSLLDRLLRRRAVVATGPDPKAADMHFTLGLSLANNASFFEQARKEFQLAVKFDPSNKEALYNLGLMNYKVGMFNEAVACFQKVTAMEKAHPHAPLMLRLLVEE